MLKNHTSSQALIKDQSGDELHHLIIMRQHELLLYFSLWHAFKHGDVDCIEALLPELLFYFTGAGNNNYAQEILEFLQFITHECTPEICAVVWQHGFMVNRLGRADSFFPIDQLQEHNNAAIRAYGPPPQSSTWELYGKMSRVIPFFAEVVEHVENNIMAGYMRNFKYSHLDVVIWPITISYPQKPQA
ncbi:hypothetical protein B0J17DRAFT_720210 [Rhizoctonia solani]|nr:hypothetical protein B0J17DRAFT_720210 [Rhizoctonia solani]